MKKFNILIFVALLTAFALPAAAQKKVDIFGYYTIVKPTRAFADISEVHLAGNYGAQQRPAEYGLIRMKRKAAKDFPLMRPTRTGRNLSFTTKTVGGVYYTFTGTFTRLGDFPETRPEGQVLLKGTLTKYNGKTKAAVGNVKFSYSAGD